MELLELAGSLGVGCFLAVIIFLMYRRDRRDSERRFAELLDRAIKSGERNTRVLTRLNTLLKRVNGKLKGGG